MNRDQPNWDVEAALAETAAAVKEGCVALDLHPDTSTEVKNRLRNDFQSQYDEARDWESDKRQVLPLARAVGALAVVATILHYLKELLKGQVAMPPSEVRPQDVYDSLKFVATYHCPKPISVNPLGGYCGENSKAANELREFRRLIASPAAHAQRSE